MGAATLLSPRSKDYGRLKPPYVFLNGDAGLEAGIVESDHLWDAGQRPA